MKCSILKILQNQSPDLLRLLREAYFKNKCPPRPLSNIFEVSCNSLSVLRCFQLLSRLVPAEGSTQLLLVLPSEHQQGNENADTLLITEGRAKSPSYLAYAQWAWIWICIGSYLHAWKQWGEVNTFIACKTSSLASYQCSKMTLIFFHFSS